MIPIRILWVLWFRVQGLGISALDPDLILSLEPETINPTALYPTTLHVKQKTETLQVQTKP